MSVFDNLDRFSDEGTFAPDGARLKIGTMQAVSGTVTGSKLSLLKNCSVVKVRKTAGFYGEGGFAVMVVEEKPAQFQFFEVGGIPNQFDLLIRYEIITMQPFETATALFEIIHQVYRYLSVCPVYRVVITELTDEGDVFKHFFLKLKTEIFFSSAGNEKPETRFKDVLCNRALPFFSYPLLDIEFPAE